ncbi:MAG: methylenetetrahydrofolate reductase [NAD(P)H] [Candidatus Omnitrophota bacterium]
MRKLTDIFKEKQQTFSFELFPPKTEEGYQKLLSTIKQLSELKPDFISVTCGAGGGTRARTKDIVDHIQETYQITGVEHLTCIGNTKAEIKKSLDDTQARGIYNILALRGDPPPNSPAVKLGKDNFKYSYQLCKFIRATYADDFSIGVAGFPEGHVLCPDRELDADYLKIKMDAGADYVITQLFFNNKDYFDYVKRLRRRGIFARVIPGIIPITDYLGILRFCQKCGTSVPKEVQEVFAPIQTDPQAVSEAGIKFAIRQCRELLENGAPGLHFYTLNKASPVDIILKEVRK